MTWRVLLLRAQLIKSLDMKVHLRRGSRRIPEKALFGLPQHRVNIPTV